MESNLSDLSLVSPSVAAAALREQDNAAALDSAKWAPTPTGSVVDHIMNKIDEQFNRFSSNIALPSRRLGASAGAGVGLGLGVNSSSRLPLLDADSDDESNASTMQLLEGCRPTDGADSPLGFGSEVGETVNSAPQYDQLMKRKPASRLGGVETESVLTEDFANKFQQISPAPNRDRVLPAAAGRNFASNTLPRTARLPLNPTAASTSAAPTSNGSATRNNLLRTSPITSRPLDQNLFNPAKQPEKYSNGHLQSDYSEKPQLMDLGTSGSFSSLALNKPLHLNGNANGNGNGNGYGSNESPFYASLAKGAAGKPGSPYNLGGRTSATPIRSSTMERLHSKISELEDLNKEVRVLRDEKQRIIDEVERMNQQLKQQQHDIRNYDMFRSTSKTKADGLRSELSDMQQKRDATLGELQQLNADLALRKGKLNDLEHSARKQVEEIRQFESLGVTRQEIDALVAQRNELFELVSQLEKEEANKYEVQKQLEQTNQDRFKDQRLFQQQYSQLSVQLQQVIQENADLKRDIERLREDASGVKRDRDNFLEQAAMQYQQRLQREVSEVQKQSNDEISNLRAQLFEANEKLKQLQRDVERKNSSLQNLTAEKQKLLEQIDRLKESDTSEMNRFYDTVQRQSNEAMRNLQQRMAEERDAMVRNQDTRYQLELDQFRQALLEKEKECLVLRDKLRYLESTCEQLSSRFACDNKRANGTQTTSFDELLSEAVDQERRKWRDEQDRTISNTRSEFLNSKLDQEKIVKGLNDEIQKLTRKLDERENELRNANSELDKERMQRSQVVAEKHRELSKVKEECRQTLQSELEKIRSQAQQTTQNDNAKYKSQLGELQKKLEENAAKENDLLDLLTRFVRPVLTDISATFGDICTIFGVEPKTFNIPVFRLNGLESVSEALMSSLSLVRDAFLHVRNAAEAFGNDMGQLKQLMDTYEQRKHSEVEHIRQQLADENDRKIDELRESMLRNYAEDIKRVSLSSSHKNSEANESLSREQQSRWKQETAEKIAGQLQKEFRNELERRTSELEQAVRERESLLHQLREEKSDLEDRLRSQKPTVDEAAAKTIKQLHEQLKQLRDENLDLHKGATNRKTTGSMQNLTEGDLGVTFARRPNSPDRTSMPMPMLERNGVERRSLPPDYVPNGSSHVRFTSGDNSSALNRSSPLNVPGVYFNPISSSGRLPMFGSTSDLASASLLGNGANNGNGMHNGHESNSKALAPTPGANANEDMPANLYETAKNKTLRQLDKDFSNLKTKLQRPPPPTMKSLAGAMNGANSFASPAKMANGNGLLNRTSPLTRPFSRIAPRPIDTIGKSFYESSM